MSDVEQGNVESEDGHLREIIPAVPISRHGITLIDISSDKKWIAYVTTIINDSDSSSMESIADRMYITRRRFTATDKDTKCEELAFSGNPVIKETKLHHTSFDITGLVEPGCGIHCQFLSISHDGRYIVLSFFESKGDGNRNRNTLKNPNCLVFDMNKDLPQNPLKIKGEGRAVFLNKKNSLAIINTNTIEIYANFPEFKNPTAIFDLSAFYTKGSEVREMAMSHKAYIENTSWFNVTAGGEQQDFLSLLTFTRHIRHNLFITPFINGIVRIWSIIEDGTRLSSFNAPKEHIMAFSTNYRYAAAYVEGTRSINIYNVKSGLLVYRLKSRVSNDPQNFTITHIRFCYDSRYVTMAGREGDQVVFEVWYVEAEKSIYRIIQKIDSREAIEKDIDGTKIVQPFVTRGMKDGHKCLKGYYTSYSDEKMIIMCLELKIDEAFDKAVLNWIPGKGPVQMAKCEINNNLKNFDRLKCGYIEIGGPSYLIRFGKHMVQLWSVDTNSKEDDPITENDKLIYIRAYKGPDYGLEYSFRETWVIENFESIKFIGGNSSGRLIVNIKRFYDDSGVDNFNNYHTEEIFLPLKKLSSSSSTDDSKVDDCKTQFDYHKLESACQALHYLFSEDVANISSDNVSKDVANISSDNKNLNNIRAKTIKIIESAVSNICISSNFFSTIAGSRTLAMLASFNEGIRVIKLIMAKTVPISIFSYARSLSELDKIYDKDDKNNNNNNNDNNSNDTSNNDDEAVSITNTCITEGRNTSSGEQTESNMPVMEEGKISYRSSPDKKRPKKSYKTQVIAPNENVLTVLIEKNQDLYKLVFNRILSDSKNIGPGCLSSLTDALLYLQEGGYSTLLLLSSKKLSHLEVGESKLDTLTYEKEGFVKAKALKVGHSSETESFEAHATMEQIKMYKGYSIQLYYFHQDILQRPIAKTFKNIMRSFRSFGMRRETIELLVNVENEVRRSTSTCVVPITNFNSYSNFPEDRPKHTNSVDDFDGIISKKKESAFSRVALDQHINNMFQQGDTVLEVLLKYKWKHFARSKFILICIIHALYYISYCTGVLFAPELYGIDLEEDFFMEHPGQIASLVIMFICLTILLIQETRQLLKKKYKRDYFFSGYNWIDMAAFALPVYTFLQLCLNMPQFVEVCSISTLILWTHAILRLRVISYFGITLETIIQLSRRMGPVLFIMLLVTLAFTQSYIVLLRLQPDSYFQDTFEGKFLGTDRSGSSDGTVEFFTSSDNGFVNWFRAFYNVWLFIYGVWDPIVEGDAGDSRMVMVMSIVFSLIAVLIFFNMVIAIMSSAVEDVSTLGKKVWVSHFTDVVSEIETLWCFDDEKYSRKNNPACLYYLADKDAIQKQRKELQDETRQLLQELGITQETPDLTPNLITL